MPNTLDLLTEWAEICSLAVDDFLDLTSPMLLEDPKIAPELQWTLKHLAIGCNLQSESALLLTKAVQLWGAEILLRTVFEGTFKYIFLCVGDDNEQKIKADEFMNQLPEIAKIRKQERLRQFFASLDNPAADEWAILRSTLIEQSELDALRAKYPRQIRQRLEQKWSFIEIARQLSVPDLEVSVLDPINKLLTYSYGVASHLIHHDANAIMLIRDRNQQSPESRAATDLAHGARQVNDLFLMAYLRSIVTFKLHRQDVKPVQDLFQLHRAFLTELTEVRQDWFSSRQI